VVATAVTQDLQHRGTEETEDIVRNRISRKTLEPRINASKREFET
jgi:hypothetical protein